MFLTPPEVTGIQGGDLLDDPRLQSDAWNEGSWNLDEQGWESTEAVRHVVAFDFGVKRNILRMLSDRGCRVTVVPAQTTAEEALALKPDGIFLSNGPGDPEPVTYVVETVKELMGKFPIFGICLGHQMIGPMS